MRKFRTTTALVSLILLLAACGGSGSSVTSGTDPTIAPPTAASGYATLLSDRTDPNEVLTKTVVLQHYDAGTGMVTQRAVTVSISATGNVVNTLPQYIVTYAGAQVVIQWNPTENRFEGSNGGTTLAIYPWMDTANHQAALSWVNVSENGGLAADWGLTVDGFNSDPAVVNGRTSTANYLGTGGVSISATDDSFWAAADGQATLTANFDTSRISGSIDLSHNNNVGPVTIADTTLSIDETDITNNTFSGTASIVPADFGMASVETISVDGMFYEAGATAVGGSISGVGTATAGNGGVTVLLNGAFLAQE